MVEKSIALRGKDGALRWYVFQRPQGRMRIAQGKRVKRAPPWVIKQNESEPCRAKENVDLALEILSSLAGLDLSRAVNPPLERLGYFHAALRALNTRGF
jgi:hypothetical protein